jgi:hypothetical protein
VFAPEPNVMEFPAPLNEPVVEKVTGTACASAWARTTNGEERDGSREGLEQSVESGH